MRLLLLTAAAIFAAACSAQLDTSLGESGLRFRTADDKFAFNMTTAAQFRYTYHDVRAAGGEGGQNGADFHNFRIAAVRTFITGHFFAREFQYRVWLVWGGPVPTFRLEDCYFRWTPHALFNVTVGQMRVPATWEYLVDHERTGLPDRAVADSAFQQGWGKGVSISGRLGLWDAPVDEGVLLYEVGVFNGVLDGTDGSQGRGEITPQRIQVTEQGRTEQLRGGFRNNDWDMRADNFNQFVDGDLMIAARVEFHPMGEVPRHMVDLGGLDDPAAWFFMVALSANWFTARTEGSGTFLGNDYHFPSRTTGTGLPPTGSGRGRLQASIFHATLDGHFRWLGLSVNWALHYRTVAFTARGRLAEQDLEDDPAVPNGVTDYGLTVDAGYFILRDRLVILVRYSNVDFDEFESRNVAGDRVDGDAFGPDTAEYGAGITWFIQGDNLKLSVDYRYVAQQLPHGRAPSGELDGTVRVPDWRVFQEVRVQLQWIF
jgi:hypothetical protein